MPYCGTTIDFGKGDDMADAAHCRFCEGRLGSKHRLFPTGSWPVCDDCHRRYVEFREANLKEWLDTHWKPSDVVNSDGV